MDKQICEKVIEYIWELDLKDLAELTRYKLADKFEINMNYLSKKFKDGTKMSLSKFIDQIKIKRAENMLKASQELTIEQISQLIGIENCQQFRKKFKKKTGINPGIYRRLNNK